MLSEEARRERKKISARKYRQKNAEKILKYNRKYKAENPELAKKIKLNSRIRNPVGRLLEKAKYRAKIKGYPCTICSDDIVVPTHCPILGIPLIYSVGKVSDNSYSLDKIIPELGYVAGNVIIMSKLANTMKNSASKEMLLKFCENAPKIYGDCR